MRRLVVGMTVAIVLSSSQHGLAAIYTITDLGTLGGGSSYGFGIGNKGRVTGRSRISGGAYNEQHAFLYSGGVMTDVLALGDDSFGYAINDNGQVVGRSNITPSESHAFLYSDGTTTDLNDLIPESSGWLLWSAEDINNDGQITGPHGRGVAALIGSTGPPDVRNTIQYAPDGIHFRPIARVIDPPKAPGGYRPDAFTGVEDAKPMSWGIAMGDYRGDPCLVRFQCDLTSIDLPQFETK